MTIISTSVDKNPLEEMEQSSESKKKKKVQNALHGSNLKTDKIILVALQGKPINIIMIQVMP